jgi:hypothetical protein
MILIHELKMITARKTSFVTAKSLFFCNLEKFFRKSCNIPVFLASIDIETRYRPFTGRGRLRKPVLDKKVSLSVLAGVYAKGIHFAT